MSTKQNTGNATAGHASVSGPTDQLAPQEFRISYDAYEALVAACESICGVFEGQDDVPRYVAKARAALAKVRP